MCALFVAVELQDDLEISSKVLGKRGGYSGTLVLMRNRATGEVIAEDRHSLVDILANSKTLNFLHSHCPSIGYTVSYLFPHLPWFYLCKCYAQFHPEYCLHQKVGGNELKLEWNEKIQNCRIIQHYLLSLL